MISSYDLTATLHHLLDAAETTATDETSQNYDALIQDLGDLEDLAKGFCEGHADWRSLLQKLRAGRTLTVDEMAMLRLVVVGDADYYVKYDEERDRCRADVARIIGEVKVLGEGEPTPDALMHIAVLCREARALAALMQHYFDSRERVRRFEAATAGPLERDTLNSLVGIVEEMVRSAPR